MKIAGLFSPSPEAGIKLERDPSLEDVPYELGFDEDLYEQLLREDLGFSDETISRLFIRATDKRTVRPRATGYYNYLANRITLKSGAVWRRRSFWSFDDDWATEEINSNLRHESKHAAQSLVDGEALIDRAVIAKSVAVSGISAALALGEHTLLDSPGLDYSDLAAVATYLVANRIGQHNFVYRKDPKEVEARAFQYDPEVKDRWGGVISLRAAA